MREGMKLMQDPRVSKLMQDPRVMKAMMKAFQLRGEVQQRFDVRAKRFARTFRLATRDDMEQLKSTIRALERQLTQLTKQQKEAAGTEKGAKQN